MSEVKPWMRRAAELIWKAIEGSIRHKEAELQDIEQAIAAHAPPVEEMVEALRVLTDAGCEFSDPRVGYESWQIDRGGMETARKALAAYDAWAKREGEK